MSKLFATSVAVALLGCSSSPPDAAPADTATLPISTSPALQEGVTGSLIITRQRDLLDRGLINVLVRNDSGRSMLLSDIELVADFFDGQPAARRSISVRSGRQVAIQVPYGSTDDCDTELPMAAELTFTFTSEVDAVPRAGRVELDGTDLLHAIRLEQCTTRRFETAVRTRFDGTQILDGTVVTGLVIEPTGASADIAVEGVSGTILVGARTPDGWTGVQLDADPVTIPLTFVVNRCDPHALAEVTKRYGLTLAVSVDGADSVDVAIDVADLVADLEAIVEQCTAETAAG